MYYIPVYNLGKKKSDALQYRELGMDMHKRIFFDENTGPQIWC